MKTNALTSMLSLGTAPAGIFVCGKEVWRQSIHISFMARVVTISMLTWRLTFAFYVRTVKHLQESDFIPPLSIEIIPAIVVARLCIVVCATIMLPDMICLDEIGESDCLRIAEA